MSDYLIDNFVNVQAGAAYRLFPFGVIYKNGKRREITKDLAARFRLPHFKPPIKLGSHEETTPAGGHILALEVRDDGLYAVPELNDQGAQAWEQGDYRYHSPEVVWEGSGYEDPASGEIIAGPLIVGDALLHTPHLGEAAALYSVQEMEAETMDNMVQVPTPIWDRFLAWMDRRPPEDKPEPEKTPVSEDADKYTAALAQAEQYKVELEALKAQQAQAGQRASLVAQLQDKERFGSMYLELRAAEEAASVMSGMTEEQRNWCMKNFGALAKQVDTSALFGEKGSAGDGLPENPVQALDTAVRSKMDAQTDYVAALRKVQAETPALIEAAYPKRK